MQNLRTPGPLFVLSSFLIIGPMLWVFAVLFAFALQGAYPLTLPTIENALLLPIRVLGGAIGGAFLWWFAASSTPLWFITILPTSLAGLVMWAMLRVVRSLSPQALSSRAKRAGTCAALGATASGLVFYAVVLLGPPDRASLKESPLSSLLPSWPLLTIILGVASLGLVLGVWVSLFFEDAA
jgi:hypothetical protein